MSNGPLKPMKYHLYKSIYQQDPRSPIYIMALKEMFRSTCKGIIYSPDPWHAADVVTGLMVCDEV